MTTEPLEAEIVQPNLALAKSDSQAVIPAEKAPLTPQQLRAVEVSAALLPAYERASTLELTEDEILRISAPFADSFVEIRPHDGLIFIPHIHISDRLNQVLKPGKWALPCRRHWMENNVMYGEYILLIRGCYVGESVGGHPYQPTNPKVNYSDSLESTAAEALRRICGKRLSCGSQVWNPEYARQWCQKYAVQLNGKWQRRIDTPNVMQPQQTQTQPQSLASDDRAPIRFDERDEKRFRDAAEKWLESERVAWIRTNTNVKAWAYALATGLIMPNEQLDALTWSHLFPLMDIDGGVKSIRAGKSSEAAAKRNLNVKLIERKEQLAKAIAEIGVGEEEQRAFEAVYGPPGTSTAEPERPKAKPSQPEEWFWGVIISVPRKGMKKAEYEKDPDTIESLYNQAHKGDDTARKRLFGLAHSMTLEPRTVGDKTYPPSEADKQTRKALDAFLAWEKAKGEEGGQQMREATEAEPPDEVPF